MHACKICAYEILPIRCRFVRCMPHYRHAYERHAYKMHAHERATPLRCRPVRCRPLRCRPVRYTPVRCTLVRCTPIAGGSQGGVSRGEGLSTRLRTGAFLLYLHAWAVEDAAARLGSSRLAGAGTACFAAVAVPSGPNPLDATACLRACRGRLACSASADVSRGTGAASSPGGVC
jgi:hypothetical protein